MLRAAMLRAAMRFEHPDGWPYETPRRDVRDDERLSLLPSDVRGTVDVMLAADTNVHHSSVCTIPGCVTRVYARTLRSHG